MTRIPERRGIVRVKTGGADGRAIFFTDRSGMSERRFLVGGASRNEIGNYITVVVDTADIL